MPLTESTAAHAALLETGDGLSALVAAAGKIDPYLQSAGFDLSDPFVALVFYINGQLISRVAAAAIFTRLLALTSGHVSPASIASLTEEATRDVGLSGAKSRAIQSLAASVLSGAVDLHALRELEDREILSQLTRLQGIGPWSAQLFLLRTLHRPDVFPAGDMGIRTALRRLDGLPAAPTPREASLRAEAWAPYRSYAAGYLWRSLPQTGRPTVPATERVS